MDETKGEVLKNDRSLHGSSRSTRVIRRCATLGKVRK